MRRFKTVSELVKAVKRLTRERGKKTALAAEFGVSRQQLNGWLAGKCDPSGQVALNLLNWVEKEEVKQKTSGGAINTTRGERPQRSKSDHEKPTSSPP